MSNSQLRSPQLPRNAAAVPFGSWELAHVLLAVALSVSRRCAQARRLADRERRRGRWRRAK